VFSDPRVVAAVVDRITFNAHIIETGTQSPSVNVPAMAHPPL
jgi:hypothetical protein